MFPGPPRVGAGRALTAGPHPPPAPIMAAPASLAAPLHRAPRGGGHITAPHLWGWKGPPGPATSHSPPTREMARCEFLFPCCWLSPARAGVDGKAQHRGPGDQKMQDIDRTVSQSTARHVFTARAGPASPPCPVVQRGAGGRGGVRASSLRFKCRPGACICHVLPRSREELL